MFIISDFMSVSGGVLRSTAISPPPHVERLLLACGVRVTRVSRVRGVRR